MSIFYKESEEYKKLKTYKECSPEWWDYLKRNKYKDLEPRFKYQEAIIFFGVFIISILGLLITICFCK